MNALELRSQILEAHESGDTRELRRLQSLYRASGVQLERGPAPGTEIRVSSTSATRSGTAATPGRTGRLPVQLRAIASMPQTIAIRRDLYREMLHLAEQSADDGMETGGYFFGRAFERGVQIVDVVKGIGADSNRGYAHVALEYWRTRPLGARERGLVLLGDWHTEPAGGRTRVEPSRADLEAWEADFRASGGSAYAGCIITPSSDPDWPWAHPVVKAWTCRQHRVEDRVLVEPATFEFIDE